MLNNIDEKVRETVKKQADPGTILYVMWLRKLRAKGIRLTKAQRSKLKEQLKGTDLEVARSIDLDLSDHQMKKLRLRRRPDGEPEIRFTSREFDAATRVIVKAIKEALPSIVESMSQVIYKAWIDSYKGVVAGSRVERRKFNAKVLRLWGKPILLLDGLVEFCSDLGDEIAQSPIPGENKVRIVLLLLHSRAVQVGREIVSMLLNGYADGAMARWRTLHELAVVAEFVAKHGDDAARRFLDHVHVTLHKDALTFQRYARELGRRRHSKKHMLALEAERLRVCNLYGSDFSGDYGWAGNALGKRSPNFTDLETDVKYDHIRPIYRSANQNVHASMRGLMERLGTPPTQTHSLLAGPSVFGVQMPGHGAAVSITQVTTCLLLQKSDYDRWCMAKAIHKMRLRTIEVFARAASRV